MLCFCVKALRPNYGKTQNMSANSWMELIVNRHPPFGNQVKDNISKLPKYELVIEQVMRYSESTAEIVITIQITNRDMLKEATGHTCTLLVADGDNKVLYRQRIMDALLVKEKSWSKKLEVRRAEKGPELSVHYISQDWVGLDVECTYTPNYLGGKRITSSSVGHNEMTCAHECCKHGVTSKRRNASTQQTPRPTSTKRVANHLQELKNRAATLPAIPSVSKRMKLQDKGNTGRVDLMQYSYKPNRSNQDAVNQSVTIMSDDEFGMYGDQMNEFSWPYGKQKGTFQSKQQNNSTQIRPKNDWEELDMYARQRQISNQDEDQESLPDLEATYEEEAGHDPDWPTVEDRGPSENFEDDFSHETDYGYAYVNVGDRPELPLEWDDRVSEQWQCDGGNQRWNDEICYERKQPNSYLLQNVNSFNQSKIRVPPRKQSLSSRKVIPSKTVTYLNNMPQYNRDTEFETAVSREAVNTHRRLNSFNMGKTKKTQCKLDEFYTGKPYSELQQTSAGKDTCCDLSSLNSQYSAGNEDGKYMDDIRQVTDKDNREMGIMKTRYVSTGLGTNTANFQGDVEEDDVENMDPDLFVESWNDQQKKSNSKWTSYFSSQSSSASDNLNWKYPARNADNQVVMETCNFANTQNTQLQPVVGKKRDMTVNRGKINGDFSDITSSNGQVHKYGQVLAWVSSSECHKQDEQDEKSIENQRSRFLTPSSKPDKVDNFAGIFDGIL